MKRYEIPAGVTVAERVDGEWIRYEDHCEAMKRVAAQSASAQPLGEPFQSVLHDNLSKLYVEDAPSASAQQAEPKRHCQNGGDVCLAGNRDGVCCPEDSCDIDDGVRAAPTPSASPASAQQDERLKALPWLDDSMAYPLEIENIGEDVYVLMSRGHHDVHEFMKQVRADGYDWPLGMPKHVWMKTTPSRDPGYSCWYNVVPTGTKGAWPATHVQEAWGDDSYEAQIAMTATPPAGETD